MISPDKRYVYEKNCGMAGVISGIRGCHPKKMGAAPNKNGGIPNKDGREAAGREMGDREGRPYSGGEPLPLQHSLYRIKIWNGHPEDN